MSIKFLFSSLFFFGLFGKEIKSLSKILNHLNMKSQRQQQQLQQKRLNRAHIILYSEQKYSLFVYLIFLLFFSLPQLLLLPRVHRFIYYLMYRVDFCWDKHSDNVQIVGCECAYECIFFSLKICLWKSFFVSLNIGLRSILRLIGISNGKLAFRVVLKIYSSPILQVKIRKQYTRLFHRIMSFILWMFCVLMKMPTTRPNRVQNKTVYNFYNTQCTTHQHLPINISSF